MTLKGVMLAAVLTASLPVDATATIEIPLTDAYLKMLAPGQR